MKIKASFDDGSAEDVRIAELLDKYKITDVTFYVPLNWRKVNGKEGRSSLSMDSLLELSRKYDIGSHTISHPMLTRIPIEQAFAEIVHSKLELSKLINKPVTKFCYPRGYANEEIRQVVRNHYAEARNTLIRNIYPDEDPVWQSTTVHVAGNRRKEYETISWLEDGLNLLKYAREEEAKGNEPEYHLWGHGWEIEKYKAWDDFEKLLKAVSNG